VWAAPLAYPFVRRTLPAVTMVAAVCALVVRSIIDEPCGLAGLPAREGSAILIIRLSGTELEVRVTQTSKVGKRGTVVIPAQLRREYGMEEGSFVITEAHEEGVLVRPAVALPVETYTRQRKAEFLLTNAVDEQDYAWAREEVRKLGLDPDCVPHDRPT